MKGIGGGGSSRESRIGTRICCEPSTALLSLDEILVAKQLGNINNFFNIICNALVMLYLPSHDVKLLKQS